MPVIPSAEGDFPQGEFRHCVHMLDAVDLMYADYGVEDDTKLFGRSISGTQERFLDLMYDNPYYALNFLGLELVEVSDAA